nr:CRE-AFF-1 protein [Haemonchus contortus]
MGEVSVSREILLTFARKTMPKGANAAVTRSGMQMQFYLGLHTTVCFRLEEGVAVASNHTDHLFQSQSQRPSSWLHTVRLDRLEHHHPVSQRYQFGIPELTSCYRTFLPNQSPVGCPAGSNAKLCCDVKFRPYRNQTYTAVKVEQPTTFATFVYTAYDYSNGRWMEKDRSTIRSQLDGVTQERYLDSQRRIALTVSAGGRASHQLETGMYFANSNPGGEMDELRKQPLNEITDNNFDRLGWYRMDENGKFHVNNGIVKMEEIHKAKVKNCHEQTYRSIIDAKNYMPGNFNLSKPLEMVYPWIQSARVYDGTQRQVIVTHAEGSNLHVTLQVTGEVDGHRLVFFHNSSRISDFTGTIIVDSRSNRYFNVTVYGASGKINGAVKSSTERDSAEIFSFTTYVHDLNVSELESV